MTGIYDSAAITVPSVNQQFRGEPPLPIVGLGPEENTGIIGPDKTDVSLYFTLRKGKIPTPNEPSRRIVFLHNPFVGKIVIQRVLPVPVGRVNLKKLKRVGREGIHTPGSPMVEAPRIVAQFSHGLIPPARLDLNAGGILLNPESGRSVLVRVKVRHDPGHTL
jgi:hypothetical protein